MSQERSSRGAGPPAGAIYEAFPDGEERAAGAAPGGDALGLSEWARVADTLQEPVFAVDAGNVIVHANPAAHELLGWAPGALQGAPLTTIVPERFRERHLAAFARFLAVAGGGSSGRLLHVPALRRDGTEVPVEVLAGTAELSGDRLVVGTVRDETERVELEYDALRFQAALLQTQSESGLEGQLVVSPGGEVISLNPRFAEMWGLPDDASENEGGIEALRLALEGVADPEALLSDLLDVRAGRAPVRDEVVLWDGRVFDRYGAPLVAEGSVLGYAWYFRDVTDHKRTERELVQAVDRSASLARTLQQSLLPPELPTSRGLDVAARYHSAGAGVDVGGDFYDVFRLRRDSLGVVIGDVCGKGAQAAALTALVRYTLRAAAMQTRSPAQALSIVNAAMVRQQPEEGVGRFATVAYAALQRSRGVSTLTVASGGHPLPLVRRGDGTVETAAVPGTLLGLFPAVQLQDHVVEMGSGDALVLFTDGVLEARAGADFFGEDRLRVLLENTAGWSAEETAAAVEKAALDFQGDDPGDDIAVLVVALR